VDPGGVQQRDVGIPILDQQLDLGAAEDDRLGTLLGEVSITSRYTVRDSGRMMPCTSSS
jgi:hypothetical protein